MEVGGRNPFVIHVVSSVESPEFAHLNSALSRSSVVGLDAEWKPIRMHQSSFPTVSLLQIACRPDRDWSTDGDHQEDCSVVFLLDLLAIPLSSIYDRLRGVFASPDVLKLGFRFNQDLAYLSSTFRSQGCDPGLDRVEPFLDITSVYNHLNGKQPGQRRRETKSLAFICKELLGISLSKELQCSDWSCRPLTEEQKTYAAVDAFCLIEIFGVFQHRVLEEGNFFHDTSDFDVLGSTIGLKQILKEPDFCKYISNTKFCEAAEMVKTKKVEFSQLSNDVQGVIMRTGLRNSIPRNDSLLQIVKKFGDKILLKESDKEPKTSKKKGKRQSSAGLERKEREMENVNDWQGPAPWDLSVGGDGCPKFLCDVMVEGLAKHLRCVGIDAAVPNSKKPEVRNLIDQTYKEKRVLLTRDAKLLRHEYLIRNQIYRVKNLLKNDQLLEVIETFGLEICEEQLMSRCTKCNGSFIQKPLSTEEAIEAAKGFQVIPNCLFDKNLEFWKCMDCNQLYWEGTQYHNAVQKFIEVCKLNTPVHV